MGAKGTWHYLVDGQQQGPITMDQLYGMASQGVVKGDTKVWCEGWSHWVTYAEYTQSKELQNTAQIAAKKAKGGKGLKIGLIIGGSLALVGGVILMIVLLAGSGDSRGFDSPEDLGNAITDALNAKDPSRIIDLFPTEDEFSSLFDCEDGATSPYRKIQKEIDEINEDDNPMLEDFSAELLAVGVKPKRTKNKGKKFKGCELKVDLERAKVKLSYRFTIDGREDEDRIRVKMIKLGDMGWFLTDWP
jgi:hypothetical protein